MASYYNDSARNGYRAQCYIRGVRRKVWLGPISATAAKEICRHLDALILAYDTQTAAPAATMRWAAAISPRLRGQLSRWGLLEQSTAAAQLPRDLAGYTKAHLDSRSDWKPRTLSRMENVRRHLIAQLGGATSINSVTPGDADRFARWARANFPSRSHSGKIIGDARQFFKAAIRDRLISDNPFAEIDSRQQHNPERAAYVPPETAAALISHACPYYAALIAAARFGGLRVPSEPLSLEWSNVDWEAGRLLVTSPKTAATKPTRLIPLFPELRPHLERLYELAPAGSVNAFDRYRSTAAKVYRSNLLRIAKLAGIPAWPKLWMNLRASCRTDLLERFPSHVVDAWLGHSGQVGAKHYDRIHAEHFARALESEPKPKQSRKKSASK